MSKAKYELTGSRFGRLVAIKHSHNNNTGTKFWLCKCDCGKETSVSSSALVHGYTISCGCYLKEVRGKSQRTHGGVANKDAEYHTWAQIKSRCYNPKNKDYPYYGGRGIYVCRKWRDNYGAFIKDLGKKPSPHHSIERRSLKRGYTPSNCYWATKIEQANNTTRCVFLRFKGVRKTKTKWARYLNVPPTTFNNWLLRGLTIKDIHKKLNNLNSTHI